MTRAPKVFISYSWDTPEHKKWVSCLAESLRNNGIDAILDQWDMAPGDSITSFVQRTIKSADFILAILTPRYNQESLSGGGVGYEREMIRGALISKTVPKVLPILRKSDAHSIPIEFQSHAFLDFSDDSKFDERFQVLLRSIFHSVSKLPLLDNPKKTIPKERQELFISYSHLNGIWLERFQTMLKPAVNHTHIQMWDDTRIKPGTKWKEEIENALKRVKVALLLVTPEFLASDFIAYHELPQLLDAAASDGLIIIWVPISSSFYTQTDIAKYQAGHNPAQPLDTLTPPRRNKAILSICEQILEAMINRG